MKDDDGMMEAPLGLVAPPRPRWQIVGECKMCGGPYFISNDEGLALMESPPPLWASCLCIPGRHMRSTALHGEQDVKEMKKKGSAPAPAPHVSGPPHPEDHPLVVDFAYRADLGLTRCQVCGWVEEKGTGSVS